MSNYLIIVLGWILGQMILITVMAIRIQRSSKYATGFKEAYGVYFKKDLGPTVLAGIVMIVALFVLPEAIAHADESVDTLGEHNKTIAHFLKWLRFYSVGFGIVSQFLGFMAVSRAEKWLKKVAPDDSINQNP